MECSERFIAVTEGGWVSAEQDSYGLISDANIPVSPSNVICSNSFYSNCYSTRRRKSLWRRLGRPVVDNGCGEGAPAQSSRFPKPVQRQKSFKQFFSSSSSYTISASVLYGFGAFTLCGGPDASECARLGSSSAASQITSHVVFISRTVKKLITVRGFF